MNSLRLQLSSLLCAAFLFPSSDFAQAETESFEDWDGVTADWLPEGWCEWHTDDYIPTLNNGSYPWPVINPADSKTLPAATDGKYYAAIGYAKDPQTNEDLYQDEWLISPAYKLSEYGGTLNFDAEYAPLFLFRVDNGFVDWGEMDFIERASSADLQILARKLTEENEWEEDWVLFKSLFADWYTQSLSALMSADFSSSRFHDSGTLFFTDDCYKNATIQIAFRYVGQYGNIMGIDKFRMGYATLVPDAPSADGINNIQTNSRKDTYFDISGRKTNNSKRGINIVSDKNGKTRKVIW